ncbi:hypothetical protein [Maricaulis maris]|uniref:hypothetical protein n=1 Tax=Maricaulis maris TaxID=74318 RepID=UPI003A950FC8
MAEPIRSICILGNGLEAWLTAHVLYKALGGEAVSIHIQPLDSRIHDDCAYTILRPSALVALDQLDLNLQGLLRLPATLPSLGQVLRSASGVDTLLPYGGQGVDWAGTSFHHHWLRARQAGLRHPYFAFSPGYHAMASDRFAPPDRRNAIGPMQHESGLHVSTRELTENLRLNLQANVIVLDPTANCEQADLVIHAPGAPDRNSTPDPVHAGPPKPYAVRVEAGGESRLQIPLRSGWLDLPTPAGPAKRHCGNSPWGEDGLVVGLAAAHLPGLEDRSMDRLLFELETLLELWPRSGVHSAETLEYNRLWAQEADEWTALSALSADQEDQRCQARKAVFRRRGYIEPLESRTITPEDWVEAFIGRGVIPAHYDRLSERLTDPQLKSELQKFTDAVGRTVREFPSFPSYLRAIDRAVGPATDAKTEPSA